MKRNTISFLKIAIFFIGMIVFVCCIFWLPTIANNTAEMNPDYAYLKIPVLLGLYISVIPFTFSLYQAWKLLRYMEGENAFSKLSVISLGYIKNCAITILTIYVLGIVFLALVNALHPGIAIIGLIIIFTTLVISFFAAVLQELFKKALQYKSENELTI
ncbi:MULTISPECIES: DUF2975 domain-containing protein [Bacillus]|uniref:DUF2975 domain-containing protein n=1 Tax=Bacillus TaxID=1386 RepID=UPI0002DAD678|nr:MULTISPECIES: DUF2975 domain-containing protein [Bacillus]